jgi:hypothetical protein
MGLIFRARSNYLWLLVVAAVITLATTVEAVAVLVVYCITQGRQLPPAHILLLLVLAGQLTLRAVILPVLGIQQFKAVIGLLAALRVPVVAVVVQIIRGDNLLL